MSDHRGFRKWCRRALLVAGVLLLVATMAMPSTAQQDRSCADCLIAARCEPTRVNCVAGCRARLFGIDPRRDACIDACVAEAARCTRATQADCRMRHQCR